MFKHLNQFNTDFNLRLPDKNKKHKVLDEIFDYRIIIINYYFKYINLDN